MTVKYVKIKMQALAIILLIKVSQTRVQQFCMLSDQLVLIHIVIMAVCAHIHI